MNFEEEKKKKMNKNKKTFCEYMKFNAMIYQKK